LLKFYWAEKLNLKIKNWKIKDSKDYKDKKIKLLYDYVCEKQLEIWFKLNWKIQTISISHFLDHYKRLLPDIVNFDFDKNKRLTSPESKNKIISNNFSLTLSRSDTNSEMVGVIE
jgi:hypothetical protein